MSSNYIGIDLGAIFTNDELKKYLVDLFLIKN